MAPRNNIEDSNQGNHTPAATKQRPGHRIREIRQELHQRHHAARYQVTQIERPPQDPLTDEYQTSLYAKSRSADSRERIAAIREAIATSPHTWEDFTVDGAREYVEESIKDDALLIAAVESLGDLDARDRPYLGKFTAERIYELVTDAEAEFWHRFWRHAGTYPT